MTPPKVHLPPAQAPQEQETFGIHPGHIYRKNDEETRRILGLKPTAIDDAIRDKVIPPPIKLTAHGKICGWLGITLIELQRKRLKQARGEA